MSLKFTTAHPRGTITRILPTKRSFLGWARNSNPASNQQDASSKKLVTLHIDHQGIAHAKLNRPEKLNALNLPMFEAIAQTARTLRNNTNVRVVILSGNGKAFCTGLDVPSILRNNPKQTVERLLQHTDDKAPGSNLAQDVGYLWRQLPVPVICCIHGMCFGGGLQIALGADLRIAHPDAQLSIMEAKWGLIPDMSASLTLRELVRMDVAKELTFTGRKVSAKEAAELGLVTRIAEDPWQEAERWAYDIVRQSPDAVSFAKQLYQTTWVADETTCLRTEETFQRKLLASWNQLVASARNFGWRLPYVRPKTIPTDQAKPQ